MQRLEVLDSSSSSSPHRAPVLATLVLALVLGTLPVEAKSTSSKDGVVLGFGAGTELPLAVWWEGNDPLRDDGYEPKLAGTLMAGYRFSGLELYAVLQGSELKSGVGVDALYSLPWIPNLLVGGGLHYLLVDGGLEVVLPRIDLRVPLSPSWELAITAFRLTYFDEPLGGTPAEVTEQKENGGTVTHYHDIARGFVMDFSIGLVARLDWLWERPSPPPLGDGLFFKASFPYALLAPTADERSSSQYAGTDTMGDTLGTRWYAAMELGFGYKLGELELAIPVTWYVTQFEHLGIGLSAMWRPTGLDLLALGGTVAYYPWELVIVRVPEIELHFRMSHETSIFLVPISLVMAFEPGRDVWVEEGLESKMPYYGLGFGLGIQWGP